MTGSKRRTSDQAGRPTARVWILCLGISAALVAPAVWGQLPEAKLTTVFPPGGQKGTTAQVTIQGRDLDEVTGLLFSHPGIQAQRVRELADEDLGIERFTPNQFQVHIDSSVPEGIWEVRAVGRFGVSNPRPFHVQPHPEQIEPDSHQQLDQAAPLPLDHVVSGRANASAIDYYRLTAKAGQTLSIELAALTLDSRLRPVLVVWDEQGVELARTLDPRDQVLVFTAPADGSYFVGVHDHVYAGGDEFVYRLRVRTGPHIEFALPPVLQSNAPSEVTVYGYNLPAGTAAGHYTAHLPQLQKQTVQLPSAGDRYPGLSPEQDTDAANPSAAAPMFSQAPSQAPFSPYAYWFLWDSDFAGANPIPVWIAQWPVVPETEPNDDEPSAQSITCPCELVGQFYPHSDRDWFQFQAQKGNAYAIRIDSANLGLHCDPRLVIRRVTSAENGQTTTQEVSIQEDARASNDRFQRKFPRALEIASLDPQFELVADQDAIYRIGVWDLYSAARDDPRLVYRLVIEPRRPDFRLVAWTQRPAHDNDYNVDASSLVVRRQGTRALYVDIDRRGGFGETIEVSLEGLPEGVECPTVTVPGDAVEATLVLTASASAPRWEGTVQVVGTARQTDGTVLRRIARPATLVWESGDVRRFHPPSRVAHQLVLSVIDAETDAALVQLGDGRVWETSLGGSLQIPLKATFHPGYKGDLTLTADGVPDPLRPKDVTLKSDAAETNLSIPVQDGKIKPGTYTLWLEGKATISYQRNPQGVARAESEKTRLQQLTAALTEQSQQLQQQLPALQQAVQQADARLAAAQLARDAVAQVVEHFQQQVQETEQQLAHAEKAAQSAADDAKSQAQYAAARARHDATSAAFHRAQQGLIEAQEAIAAAEKQVQTARQQQTQAEQNLSQLSTKIEKANQAQQDAEKRLAEANEQNKAKDVITRVTSGTVTLLIKPSPLDIQLPADPVRVTAGQTVEVPVSLVRNYGFAGPITLRFQPPDGEKHLSASDLTVAADQSTCMLEVKAAPELSPGVKRCRLEIQLEFNGVTVKDERALILDAQRESENAT